jgi:DNA-binding transcriptional LysR family regulator
LAWHEGGNEPLPLISYDDACLFRSIGTSALDRENRPWRIAFTSPNLSGLWAGVEAGFGLTVRTPLGLPAGVKVLDEAGAGLPALPSISLSIYRNEAQLDPVAERLVAIVTDEVRSLI